jgi:uncharacterized protein
MRILVAVIYSFYLSLNATHAQDLPAPQTPFVSDLADLIDAETESGITRELRTLKQERGTEMAVVTIDSRATYGGDTSLEAFSTGLFNDWGIGDADRNDGILFLVSRDDRETRIELGAGYAPIYDDRMKAVIDNTIMPHFRQGDFAAGIDAGVLEIIKRTEFAFADSPAERQSWFNTNRGLLLFGSMLSLIAFIKFRGKLQDLTQRFRRCPTCGHRTISVRRTSTKDPDLDSDGVEERSVWCNNCDYRRQNRRTVPRKRLSTGSGSFGGGRSSGGGASGRW